MWLAEKSAGRSREESECLIGIVTIGGERPSVLAEGELRSAELLQTGAVRLPKIGEELLLVRTSEGDCVAVGRVGGETSRDAENGEIQLMNGNAGVVVDNQGKVILTGDITLTGTININGTLLINGQAYSPPAAAVSTSETGA